MCDLKPLLPKQPHAGEKREEMEEAHLHTIQISHKTVLVPAYSDTGYSDTVRR